MTSLLNIAANSPAEDEVEEGQSLRFEDGDSPYLSLTPSSAGNQDVWTFSAWVKRGNIGSIYPTIFAAGTTTTDRFLFRFSADTLDVFWRDANTTNRNLTTNALYRDCSAWYHVVLAVDTTDATTANRMRLYVNGDEVTSFSADSRSTLSSGSTLAVNDAVLHTIGTRAYSVGNYYEGYIANACFIDGQQLDPTSFGEYKDTLWKPKDVSGLTFGTNGFFLDFSDSSAIGDDTSGNSNDWTANNLVATDVVLDSPVNGGNFCVWNPLDTVSSSFAEGNLSISTPLSGGGYTRGTVSLSSGKWYWEIRCDAISGYGASSQFLIGITESDLALSTFLGIANGSITYFGTDGNKYVNGTSSSYGSTYTTGDIIGVALNLDDGEITFYKNNVSQGVATTGLTGEWCPCYNDGSNGAETTITANFGQDSSFAGNATPQGNTDGNGQGDFYYAPPSGFLCLKTSSLPAPTITAPDEHFNTVLWSGTGSTQSVTGVGFQPDLLWTKARNATYSHVWYDAVRGLPSGSTNTDLIGDTADIENTYGLAYVNLASFDTDGFTTGSTTSTDVFNTSGTSQVSWCWLGNNGTVSNASGTIASTVSANTDAGFSIVSWTDDASTSSTVGHGLNSTPELIITKNRDGGFNWFTWTTVIDGSYDYLSLNTSDSKTDDSTRASPTSSVFTNVGSTSGNRQIAYCFHSVAGYSKIGSYTGSTSLPFVHCGFRPAWVLIKRTDTGSSESWVLKDTKRSPYNESTQEIYPQLNNTEFDDIYSNADFLSNGFKLRSNNVHANTASGTYIFLAFAEAPFTRANAR